MLRLLTTTKQWTTAHSCPTLTIKMFSSPCKPLVRTNQQHLSEAAAVNFISCSWQSFGHKTCPCGRKTFIYFYFSRLDINNGYRNITGLRGRTFGTELTVIIGPDVGYKQWTTRKSRNFKWPIPRPLLISFFMLLRMSKILWLVSR